MAGITLTELKKACRGKYYWIASQSGVSKSQVSRVLNNLSFNLNVIHYAKLARKQKIKEQKEKKLRLKKELNEI